MHDRPIVLVALFARAYSMIGFQIPPCPFVLAAAGRFAAFSNCSGFDVRLGRIDRDFDLVPAMGLYYYLGLAPADYPNIVPATYYDYCATCRR